MKNSTLSEAESYASLSAAMTVRSVDKIGETSALELEKSADTFLSEAKEISESLYRFAKALRESTRIASENLAVFCNQATSVMETAKSLQTIFMPPENAEPIPKFLNHPKPDQPDQRPVDFVKPSV